MRKKIINGNVLDSICIYIFNNYICAEQENNLQNIDVRHTFSYVFRGIKESSKRIIFKEFCIDNIDISRMLVMLKLINFLFNHNNDTDHVIFMRKLS